MSKPFVSYNKGHDRNPAAPKFKQQAFEIEGVNGKFDVAIWIKEGKNGEQYAILKLEDAVAAEQRRHEWKMVQLEGPVGGTDVEHELDGQQKAEFAVKGA